MKILKWLKNNLNKDLKDYYDINNTYFIIKSLEMAVNSKIEHIREEIIL